jgi:tetratricopeptide (TPR) repeat protein
VECAGQLADGNAAFEGHDFAHAEAIYSSAMERCEKVLPAADRVLALANLAFSLAGLGKRGEEADALRRAIALLPELPADNQPDRIILWQALGSALYYQGLYAKAEEAYEKALQLLSRSEAADPLARTDLLMNLGVVYTAQGHYREAGDILQQARDLIERTPSTDPMRRIGVLANIATLYHHQGRSDALGLFQQALSEIVNVSDPLGTLTLSLLNNIGIEYMTRHEYAAAGAILARAVALVEHGSPYGAAGVAKVLSNYRVCLQKIGSRQQLREFDRMAHTILSKLPHSRADGLVVDVTGLRRED